MNEIGGGFWLSEDYLKECLSQNENHIVFHSQEEQHLSTCRSGLRKIASLFQGKGVLIPIFTCGTVVDAFAEYGCKIIPYKINGIDLSIDWEDVKEKVLILRPSLIIFHTYFGYPTVDNPSMISWIREQGIKIVDDITCSLLSLFTRIESDFVVGSIRKWFPLPDGGLLVGTRVDISSDGFDDELVHAKLKAFLTKDAYLSGADIPKTEMLRLFQEAISILNSRTEAFSMSPVSDALITEDAINIARSKRRENYNRLHDIIEDIPYVHMPLGKADQTIVPYMLPIIVSDRSSLQSYLASHDVYATVLWTKPECIMEECKLYESILCFPVSQEYDTSHMEFVGDLLKTFYADMDENHKKYE